MDNGEPPCRRCVERNLSCVLNKSLQTLISEGSMWKEDMHRDLSDMHSSIQDVLKRLNMPPLQPLRSFAGDDVERSPMEETAPPQKREQAAPSLDSSPKIAPRNESLQSIPIESLYQITRLRSLRSETAGEGSSNEDGAISDVVSKGIIPVEDAERLINLYLRRLDHFAYSIANKFTNLQSIRRRSPELTAVICTVAALHDSQADRYYESCLAEFKRLLSASMFHRRVDRESLRAMCIGAFWLSDISWTLSGHAIRRAMAISLNANYHRLLAEASEDAIDCLRLWYFLYICDQHLSVLYGRTTIIRREETSIQGTSRYIESPAAVEQDRRMASQVELLVIMGNARQFFGRDMGGMLAPTATEHISHYNALLDDWMQTWVPRLIEIHDSIGDFPSRGVILHYNLAKLHLHSHVFRGLGDSPVPPHFHNSAVMAAGAATQIFELLLTDASLRDGLVGVPHYTHTMIAFASGFLLQLTAKYENAYVNSSTVQDLIGRLVEQLRSMPTGSFHLVRLLVEGLEKMLKSSKRSGSHSARPVGGFQPPAPPMNNGQMHNGAAAMDFMPRHQHDFGLGQPDPFTMPDFGMSSSFLPFEDVNSLFRSTDLGYL
ncbi:hypothetical protein BDV97DRAFT_376290 [Delphinella strobiligena]|nr:hypothetical protein BDV97DRAFT_376290 [Delphinella strobiligena]